MPTTCGFPNCRFRSRYRGAEDNRHFYRVPKKPAILRKKWLEAIGRTEETIVSQLRVCSGHFHGGEKHDGDIPVADPTVDPLLRIELPPKSPRILNTSGTSQRSAHGPRNVRGRNMANSNKQRTIMFRSSFPIFLHRNEDRAALLPGAPRGTSRSVGLPPPLDRFSSLPKWGRVENIGACSPSHTFALTKPRLPKPYMDTLATVSREMDILSRSLKTASATIGNTNQQQSLVFPFQLFRSYDNPVETIPKMTDCYTPLNSHKRPYKEPSNVELPLEGFWSPSGNRICGTNSTSYTLEPPIEWSNVQQSPSTFLDLLSERRMMHEFFRMLLEKNQIPIPVSTAESSTTPGGFLENTSDNMNGLMDLSLRRNSNGHHQGNSLQWNHNTTMLPLKPDGCMRSSSCNVSRDGWHTDDKQFSGHQKFNSVTKESAWCVMVIGARECEIEQDVLGETCFVKAITLNETSRLEDEMYERTTDLIVYAHSTQVLEQINRFKQLRCVIWSGERLPTDESYQLLNQGVEIMVIPRLLDVHLLAEYIMSLLLLRENKLASISPNDSTKQPPRPRTAPFLGIYNKFWRNPLQLGGCNEESLLTAMQEQTCAIPLLTYGSSNNTLKGKVVGLLNLNRATLALANRLHAFECILLSTESCIKADQGFIEKASSVDEMVAHTDYLVLIDSNNEAIIGEQPTPHTQLNDVIISKVKNGCTVLCVTWKPEQCLDPSALLKGINEGAVGNVLLLGSVQRPSLSALLLHPKVFNLPLSMERFQCSQEQQRKYISQKLKAILDRRLVQTEADVQMLESRSEAQSFQQATSSNHYEAKSLRFSVNALVNSENGAQSESHTGQFH